MKRLTTMLLVAGLMLTASPAFAEGLDPALPALSDVAPNTRIKNVVDTRQKLEYLLSGYEYFPSKADLLKVSPEAPLALMLIAADTNMKPSTRHRAIDALGLFEGDEHVARFLEGLLAEGKASSGLIRHSITSAMKAHRDTAVPWVTPYLQHGNFQVQLTAVNSVGKFGGDDGRAALRTLKLRPNLQPLMIEKIQAFVP